MSNFGLESMVSWKDYQGMEGFGSATQEDIENLHKALTVGDDINPPASAVAGDGFALRVESLERTLRSVTYRMEHVLFWRSIPKLAAYNTVEEHNMLLSYSDNPDSGWIAEGDLPVEDDSTYERKHVQIRFMGTTRQVSHVSTIVKPAHGPLIAQETVNGTMKLLRLLERSLYYADSDLSALQFDGFEKQIEDNSPATNIVDLRGQPLSEDLLTDLCMTIHDSPNYGRPTHMHLNPKVKSDLCKTFYPKERHNTLSDKSGIIGLNITGFESEAGTVQFVSNTFLDRGLGLAPSSAAGKANDRPGSPSVSTAATTPAAALSEFAADDAGSYYYKIAAVNRYGRSAAVDLAAGSAVAVAAGDETTWAMTPGSGGDVDYYVVYRSKVGGAVTACREILRVPNAAGTGAQTIHDYNASLPETTSGFIFQQNVEVMSFKQLAPMIKIPLATLGPSVRWMQLIYGAPVLYVPGRAVLIKNIGRAAGYVGAP